MKTPLDKRRMSVWERASGAKREGEGWILPLGEMAQRLLYERNKQDDSLKKRGLTLPLKEQKERKEEIAKLEWAIGLLLRDSRLTAIQIEASPEALAMLDREILGHEEAVQSLIKFKAEMRELGCPSIVLHFRNPSIPSSVHMISAFGERDGHHHSYRQPLRGGPRSYGGAIKPAPTGVGLGLAPFSPPDWPPMRPQQEEEQPATIVVTAAAYQVLLAAQPAGTPPVEPFDEKGDRLISLKPHVHAQLNALRGPKESYSSVILRLAASE